MINLEVTVYQNRDYLGKFVLKKDNKEYKFNISAKTDPELKMPDPPTGTFQMIRIVENPKDNKEAYAAYGPYLIFFEAQSGDAINQEKDSNGKFILSLHGGYTDVYDQLIPTEQSLRLTNENIETLIGLIKDEDPVMLTVIEEEIGIVNRLRLSKISTQAAPKMSTPHLDEDSTAIDLDPPYVWYTLYSSSHPQPVPPAADEIEKPAVSQDLREIPFDLSGHEINTHSSAESSPFDAADDDENDMFDQAFAQDDDVVLDYVFEDSTTNTELDN